MNALAFRSWFLVLLFSPLVFAAEKLDIRRGVPENAYLAVYGQHNPERDFQREYGRQIWQTVEKEKLPERIITLLMEQLPAKERETATSISDELQTIFEPVDWSAVGNSPEAAYGQVMDVPQTHHLALLRLPSREVAESLEIAVKNLGQMIERRSEGAVEAAVDESGKTPIYTLTVPKAKEFPFQPAFARLDDVLVFSTSTKVLSASVDSLLTSGTSKFDDPRLAAALKELPAPEDALVFYDGRQQFAQMKSIGQFIREKAPNDANAVRAAGLMERVFNELAILDNTVTVVYTENHRNLKTERGQLVPDAESKLLYRVCAQGEPFENWQRWVPADAQAYSLFTGVNLHALYEEVEQFLRDEVPEAQPALEKFEQAQQAWGVHLDRDILQAFSGECVSVTLPAATPTVVGGKIQVVALRCQKPERIRELLHQAVDRLGENPYVQAQQLKLEPSKELEGFDELSLNMLTMFGVRPVIGFRDGWMIVGSNAAAADKVLRTLAGQAPSIDKAEAFTRFGLEIEGPVYAISYTDLATSTRQAAQFIRQAGNFAPMIVGMAGAQGDPKKLKPLQDALALLPAIANVVEKFDYLEARLSVVQNGDAEGSYVKRSVTLVRPPEQKPKKTETASAAR